MEEQKINVKWEVSEESGSEYLTLEDLGVESMQEWQELSYEEQKQRVQEALDDLPNRVYIVADCWDEL